MQRMPELLLSLLLVMMAGGIVLAACPVGDIYEDCEVNWQDLKFLSDHWLESAGSPADVVGGDGVNLGDFATVVDHWLEEGSSTGSLEVTILPQEAVDAGAKWLVDGGSWQSSGNMLTLSVGFHNLEFQMIDGWAEPVTEAVHILEGETTLVTGTYVLQTGSIRITVSPGSAIDLGAQWRLSGGVWRPSDYTEPNLPAGWYTVEFDPIDGWAEPDDMDVEVSTGLITAIEASYEHPIVINEFLASNSYSATDPQGEDDDWIELYNRGEDAVDVGGMYMTDDPGVPTKWEIPDDNPAMTTIEPNDYLLIWADGDVEDYPDGLHAGFELDDAGDDIYLFDSNSAIRIDKIEFSDQDPNISYGRYPDGNDTWQLFGVPTPGSQNIPSYEGFVSDVKFSHDRGFYESAFTLTMACETEGSDVYYSRDGSEPGVYDGRNFSGIRFVGPLPISETTYLRARAVKGKWMPSDVDAQTYIFLDDVINQPSNPDGFPTVWRTTSADYEMDSDIVDDHLSTIEDDLKSLPTMCLVTTMDDMFGYDNGIYSNPNNEGVAWERPCSVELFYPDGSEDGFQVNCGIRIYGGVGRNDSYRKKTFRLLFKGIYGPTKLRYRLFGEDATDEFDTIILRANFNDGYPWGGSESQFIRDEWMRRTQQAMGHPSAIGTFVHLYVNGLYWGLYNPVQRPDTAFSASYYAGDKDEWDGINSTRTIGDSERTAWSTLMGMCNSGLSTNEEYQRLQGNDPDGTNNSAYEDYLEVDQYISFLLTNFYGGNNDWMSHNWYAGRRRGLESTGWKAYTWDAEWVLDKNSGVTENCTGDTTSSDYLLKPYTYLRNNIEFKMLFADYAHKAFYNGGLLYVDSSSPDWDPAHPERNRPAEVYAGLADIIEQAMVCETARWGDTGGGSSHTVERWRTERDSVLGAYMRARSTNVLGYLRGAGLYPSVAAPVFNINGSYKHGGIISSTDSFSMTGIVGTAYYTIDGSDPRMPMTSEVTGTTLVSRSMPKRALVPAGSISDDWRGGAYFNDSSWAYIAEEPGGVGYEEGSGYESYISYDVETLMNGDAYPATFLSNSAMIRIPFTVSSEDMASFNFMTLKVQYDDGFVAFINGQWIDEQNFSGNSDDPDWNASSSGNHEASGSFDTFDATDDLGKLQVGDNILAIQGLNTSSSSSDFIINAELVAGASTSSGGSVSPTAVAYAIPLTFDKSTHIKARSKSGSTWSALNEATYGVGPVAERLRITEIMYHPEDTGDPNDPNEEYIELTNLGPETINLNLVQFTNGIDFTFGDIELGSGEYVVVVRDEAAFMAAHPAFSGIIAGDYSGSLDNGGERIELVNATGQTILDFSYQDGWHEITDGGGYSLTIIDPSDNVRDVSVAGLVGHWAFDDGSGAVATDGVGSNHGTVHGDQGWTAGRVAGALNFDGSGDYVSLAAVDALAGDSLTVEAWVYLIAFVDLYNPVQTQHTSGGDGYYFYTYEGKPSFSVVDGAGYAQAASSEVLSVGRWYHLAGTNDSANLRLYVDGELQDIASSIGLTGRSYDAYIGYDLSAPTYYTGVLDDVRVYNRALSEYEFEGVGDMMDRWSEKESWRASAYSGGSPGWDDSGIVPNPGAIVINEILAHSHAEAADWIELYNTTDAEIDIGDWWLSDNDSILMKYQFAAGTKIGAYDYLVLREDVNFGDDSSDPGSIMGFGFSENGEGVYLSSAEANVLTGYRAGEDFGASYTGISFGRYFKRSTGNHNFVPMDYNTPGDRNSYPAVGPVVINEIMYNPAWPNGGAYGNDRYEYIELKNITDEPVRLWREDKALPWKLSEGIEFTFGDVPDDVTIAAGDYVVVVRDVNAFTWLYPTVAAGKIFGPYEGGLDDGGEQLNLSRLRRGLFNLSA